MAVDKLVDSTQLDANLTSVANAIRTKGGTSAELAFPQGFVDAVDAIPTGGATDLVIGTRNAGFTSQNFFCSTPFRTITLNINTDGSAGNNFNASNSISGLIATEKVIIKMMAGHLLNLGNMIKNLETPTLEFDIDFSSATTIGNLVVDSPHLERIIGSLIDFSSILTSSSYMTPFLNCPHLQDVRFAENTLARRINFAPCVAFSLDTLISLANSLSSTVPSNIQLPNSKRSITEATYGTVTDGIFAADPSGTMTLADFITTTKGWTIAWA